MKQIIVLTVLLSLAAPALADDLWVGTWVSAVETNNMAAGPDGAAGKTIQYWDKKS